MEIEVIERNEDNFILKLKGKCFHIVKFRNIILTEIKTYAPQLVKFNEYPQDSCLKPCDLAHRIGLIIVHNFMLDKEKHMIKNKYYKCILEVRAKKNFERVLSNDIELLNKKGERTGIFPFIQDVLITELLENEELNIEIIIDKNNGGYNIKYRPGKICSLVESKNEPETYIVTIRTYGAVTIEKFYDKIIKKL